MDYLRDPEIKGSVAPNLSYVQYYEYAWLIGKAIVKSGGRLQPPDWSKLQENSIVIDQRLDGGRVSFHGSYVGQDGVVQAIPRQLASLEFVPVGTEVATRVQYALTNTLGTDAIGSALATRAVSASIGQAIDLPLFPAIGNQAATSLDSGAFLNSFGGSLASM